MSSGEEPKKILELFTQALLPFGIDIVHPLALNWYNECLSEAAAKSKISPLSKHNALVLLIGNSSAIWQPFLTACTSDDSILNHPHPLEAYIERSIQTAIGTIDTTTRIRIFWSHERSPESGEFIAMQRMAECAGGLAYLDHVSHLSMHSKFGPWFSLRCCLVFDTIEYACANAEGERPPPVQCPLDEETQAAVKVAAEAAFSSYDCSVENSKKPGISDVFENWRLWLAVRDTAAPGHLYRYSNEQILYLYTGNRQLLRELVAKLKNNK